MENNNKIRVTSFSNIKETSHWTRYKLKQAWKNFNLMFIRKCSLVLKPYNIEITEKHTINNVISNKEKKKIYETLFKEQKGVCAICNQVPKNRKLSIDHDHKTRKIRGLLCGRCNIALGFFKDNIFLLQRALNYLITQI